MQLTKTLCLTVPFLRGRYDDDKVGRLVGMMVLIDYVIHIISSRTGSCTEGRNLCHLIKGC